MKTKNKQQHHLSTHKLPINKQLKFVILFLCLPFFAWADELVIGTTFSSNATSHLMQVWEAQNNTLPIRTLNRTSSSLRQLLLTDRSDNVDLILSSSPMLFHTLQQQNKLALLPNSLESNKKFVPQEVQLTTVAFSLSGYGILSNSTLLNEIGIKAPASWEELIQPNLHGLVIISSPSRSETNHIMLEGLLQQHGWETGWALINQISANVGTISSRSFGVVEKIQANLGATGISIDNYVNLLTQNGEMQTPHLIFNYFNHFPASPTFIAITKNSNKQEEALKFIQFLLSDIGQKTLSDSETGKFPIIALPQTDPLSKQQQFLFSQPQINYSLMIKRQNLVKLLFEHQITYRLTQLQENWQILYQKEIELNKTLPELRKILTAVPIDESLAQDHDYLTYFHENQELLRWQSFFIDQQIKFITALENL